MIDVSHPKREGLYGVIERGVILGSTSDEMNDIRPPKEWYSCAKFTMYTVRPIDDHVTILRIQTDCDETTVTLRLPGLNDDVIVALVEKYYAYIHRTLGHAERAAHEAFLEACRALPDAVVTDLAILTFEMQVDTDID